MLTGFLIVFPLLASLILFSIKGEGAKKAAFAFSLVEFGLSLLAYVWVKSNPGMEALRLNCTWVQSLGIKFAVGLDGLSMLLVLLTTFLVPLIVLSSFKTSYERPNSFYGLILLMQSALVGVFVANDGFLFYVFWELALIPIYFICLVWGGENRARITFKFFLYTLFGSLFMLIGLIFLYNHTGLAGGDKSWAINDLYAAGRSLTEAQQSFVFWTIFLAFAIKMPIFPLHTWQPDTYVNAPTQGTMLLSGIMLKMGTFGLLKWLLPIVPLALAKWGGVAMGFAVVGIIYASCIAIMQKDYKRLIAYSSIAHVGLIAAGILAANQQGLQGAVIQMLSHGVNVVGLFLIADLFLIIMLGSVALPLTNGFVGEFLLIGGVFQYSAWMGAFAGLTVILGAVYMLRSYQAIMLGEKKSNEVTFGSLADTDKAVLLVICVAVIAFGVYPKPLNDLAEPAVKALLMNLK